MEGHKSKQPGSKHVAASEGHCRNTLYVPDQNNVTSAQVGTNPPKGIISALTLRGRRQHARTLVAQSLQQKRKGPQRRTANLAFVLDEN